MFNVEDVVDVPSRGDLTAYGTIRELLTHGRALVHFVIPRQEKERNVCDDCGFRTLSRNVGTGEIVCMDSDCGHEHGFDERDEALSFDLLVNITNPEDKKKAEFCEQFTSLVQKGVDKQFLTQDDADRILQIV